ncbi:hypothetical protein T4C_5209 [Trichinella pseudospiralis]|uniref:Uncharacterized protein n=1 Tax=Trichinella pseudospiralis TaxID=6337 RepID=A0A0V1GKU8_TRIPS|nr:hypothetical protein T4C_5209 [Trichinella pseudospiralis]
MKLSPFFRETRKNYLRIAENLSAPFLTAYFFRKK